MPAAAYKNVNDILALLLYGFAIGDHNAMILPNSSRNASWKAKEPKYASQGSP